MSATLSAGPGTLVLTVNTPTDTAGSTITNGTTVTDVAIPRDDLIGMKVWYSTSSTFDPAASQGTLAYNGSGLSTTIAGLTAGTLYYVKYALISEIEPDNYTISSALSATPVTAEAYSPPTFYISNYGSTFRKDISGSVYPTTGIIIETGYSNFKSSPQPTFQWKKDGVNISGATNFSYTVPASDYTDGSTTHTYSCVVTGTDTAGVVKSVTSSTTIPLISDGSTGPRTATGYLYYQTAVATDPGSPSASNYNFTTGQFATLTNGWGYTPISPSTSDTTLKAWVCRYTVAEPTYGTATGAATISATSASINFNGIVTFSNYASGSTPLATAASVAGKLDTTTANSSTFANSLVANTTVIDGGKITTGIIAANRLDLSGVLTATSVGNTGTTTIDGGRIGTGIINANRLDLTGVLKVGTAANDINTNSTTISGGQITTGSISADRLSIGNTTSTNRIRLYDNKIEVWADNGSGTSVRRVVLGDLS